MDKREVIMRHFNNPQNKRVVNDPEYITKNTRNSSCIDNLDIYLKIKDGIIEDVAYSGEACAISISSASIMSSNLKGQSISYAKKYLDNMEAMLNGEEYAPDILGESLVYSDTKNTNRKTCAWLPFKAVRDILETK